jgi:hypothetical protein
MSSRRRERPLTAFVSWPLNSHAAYQLKVEFSARADNVRIACTKNILCIEDLLAGSFMSCLAMVTYARQEYILQ